MAIEFDLYQIMMEIDWKHSTTPLRLPTGRTTPWNGPDCLELDLHRFSGEYTAAFYLNRRKEWIASKDLAEFCKIIEAHSVWQDVRIASPYMNSYDLIEVENTRIAENLKTRTKKSGQTREKNNLEKISIMDKYLSNMDDIGENLTPGTFIHRNKIEKMTPTRLSTMAGVWARHNRFTPYSEIEDNGFPRTYYPEAILAAALLTLEEIDSRIWQPETV